MSCPALKLSPHKPKRSRLALAAREQKRGLFSDRPSRAKHRSDRLIAELREHQKAFPRFASQLSQCIESISAHASRTRAKDQEKILAALKEWSFGMTVKELTEDTGFTDWHVRQTLSELVIKGKVEKKRELRAGMYSKQWCEIYYPKLG